MEKVKSKVTTKKVLSIVLNSFFYLFIAFMLFFAIANIRVKTTMDVPNVLGTGFLTVQSDSMEGNEKNSFSKGDLVFVKAINDKNRSKRALALKEGDIITFYDTRIEHLNTHRIVEIKIAADGKREFITQGDKTALEHPYIIGGVNDSAYHESIHEVNLLGIYKSSWRGAGKVLDYLQTPLGFALVIVIPTALLFGYELFVLIRLLMQSNKEKLEAKHAEEKAQSQDEMEKKLAEERELMRQQLMEELKNQQEQEKEQ